MKTEIERKFIVSDDGWRDEATHSEHMRQGYFARGDDSTVRVRLVDGQGVFTIKGPTYGITRAEYEYEIPAQDAREMLDIFCEGRQLEKTRYHLEHGDFLWVVDEFEGDNAPLILAEIELERPDQPFDVPSWVDDEVSRDRRYTNGYLAQNPYSTWETD
ncbi:MAG: CYTH domain-containing protein [Myxococcota bacterium]